MSYPTTTTPGFNTNWGTFTVRTLEEFQDWSLEGCLLFTPAQLSNYLTGEPWTAIPHRQLPLLEAGIYIRMGYERGGGNSFTQFNYLARSR
jgi:hypothetical protein